MTKQTSWFLWVMAAVVLVVDQVTKWWMVKLLSVPGTIPVIDNVFHWTLVYNRGAAFGWFQEKQVVLMIISLLVIGGIVVFRKAIERDVFWVRCGYALVLGGSLGNFVDRLRISAVIDFIDFRVWPVFNVADSAICVGVVFLILCSLFSFIKDR